MVSQITDKSIVYIEAYIKIKVKTQHYCNLAQEFTDGFLSQRASNAESV